MSIFIGGSGGGGGSSSTANLQAVCTVGNTTNTAIIASNGSNDAIVDPANNISFTDSSGNIGAYIFHDGVTGGLNLFNWAGQVAVLATAATAARIQELQDATGTIALLADIPTAFDLQTVTTAGNTTDIGIVIDDGTGLGTTIELLVNNGILVYETATPSLSMAFNLSGGIPSVDFGGGGAFTSRLELATQTANRNVGLPDQDGFLVCKNIGTFTDAAFTGSSIVITHGLGFTPDFATIVARNAATATAMASGWFVASYSGTQITVTLVVAVVGAISVELQWMAYL